MVRDASVSLSDELLSQLDQLATALNRPRDWLIEQAITRYIEQETFEVAAITEALADYREGDASLRPHEDVMAHLEARILTATDDAHPLA